MSPVLLKVSKAMLLPQSIIYWQAILDLFVQTPGEDAEEALAFDLGNSVNAKPMLACLKVTAASSLHLRPGLTRMRDSACAIICPTTAMVAGVAITLGGAP